MGDLPQVTRWVNAPHVVRWWDDNRSRGAGRPRTTRRGSAARTQSATGSGRSTVARSGSARTTGSPTTRSTPCSAVAPTRWASTTSSVSRRSWTVGSAPSCCGCSCATSSSRRTTGSASCTPPPTTATRRSLRVLEKLGATTGTVVRRAAVRRRRRHGRRLQHRRARGVPVGVTRVGISGWRYPPWRGDFYPKGLPQRRELEYAARQLTSIEINGSFYSLQRPSSYAKWRSEVPEDFVFSRQGRPLHHPHEAAPRRRGAAGQLLRLRRARPRLGARSDPLAAAGDLRLRRAGAGGLLRAAATDDHGGRRARGPPRRQGHRRPSSGRARSWTGRCPTPWSPGT